MRYCGWTMICLAGLSGSICGCSSGEIFYRPKVSRNAPPSSVVLLNEMGNTPGLSPAASNSPSGEASNSGPQSKMRTADGVSRATSAPSVATTQPVSATQPTTTTPQAPSTTQPARSMQFSTPTPTIRQMSLVQRAAVAASWGELRGPGREAGEAQLSGGIGQLTSAGNAPGLGAPQPLTSNVIVGQDGLQPGIAIGFGPPRPDNLFTRNFLPISGPGGACEALRRAGFPVTQCPHQ